MKIKHKANTTVSIHLQCIALLNLYIGVFIELIILKYWGYRELNTDVFSFPTVFHHFLAETFIFINNRPAHQPLHEHEG